MPTTASSAPSTLNALREIQNYNYPGITPSATAPDFCLAAARFVAAKLIGILQRSQRLNGFLSSADAKATGMTRAELSLAWGKLTTLDEFNARVLPTAIKWGGQRATAKVEFCHLWNDAAQSDVLLRQQVPLVTGISLSSGSRDHFIVIIKGTADAIWAVDSWGETGPKSVVSVPSSFTFTKAVRVGMNAGSAIIPCAQPFVGYFREVGTQFPLKTSIAL